MAAMIPQALCLDFGDMDVLGKLAHREHSTAAYIERVAGFRTYLEFLREHDLVRTDISLHAQVYMVSAIFSGFFLAARLVPDELTLPDEEMAELLAETVHCTLESGRVLAPDEGQVIARTFMEYLNRTMAAEEK